MSVTTTIVTVVAAVWVGFSAVSLFRRAEFVAQPLVQYGVPASWWPWLATAKAAGAVGLLVGLAVPIVGYLAAAGLIIYFGGAVVTVIRARVYSAIPFPLLYLAPVAAALTLSASR